MAEWVKVAEGANLKETLLTVADMELPKGTKMQVVMKTSMPWLFDLAGAELAFKPLVPDNMALVDVWGEDGLGIVEMEADPVWLGVAILFIKTHWWAAMLTGVLIGFILGTIVTAVAVFILKVPAIAQIPVWLIVGAVAGVAGLLVIASRKPKITKA